MYREMGKELLPKADAEDLVAGYTCMVGVTESLDLEKYPKLKGDDHCKSEAVLGGESRSVSLSFSLAYFSARPSILYEEAGHHQLLSMFLIFTHLLSSSGVVGVSLATGSAGVSKFNTKHWRRPRDRCSCPPSGIPDRTLP